MVIALVTESVSFYLYFHHDGNVSKDGFPTILVQKALVSAMYYWEKFRTG